MVKDPSNLYTCSTCKTEARSIRGTSHRRCSGQDPAEGQDSSPPRDKHDALPSAQRGTWE